MYFLPGKKETIMEGVERKNLKTQTHNIIECRIEEIINTLVEKGILTSQQGKSEINRVNLQKN